MRSLGLLALLLPACGGGTAADLAPTGDLATADLAPPPDLTAADLTGVGVQCGMASCPPGQRCCGAPGGPPQCQAMSCPMFPLEFVCDGPEDCAAGSACCLQFTFASMMMNPRKVESGCRPEAMCPAGETMTGMERLATTRLCSPADCAGFGVNTSCCSSNNLPGIRFCFARTDGGGADVTCM